MSSSFSSCRTRAFPHPPLPPSPNPFPSWRGNRPLFYSALLCSLVASVIHEIRTPLCGKATVFPVRPNKSTTAAFARYTVANSAGLSAHTRPVTTPIRDDWLKVCRALFAPTRYYISRASRLSLCRATTIPLLSIGVCPTPFSLFPFFFLATCYYAAPVYAVCSWNSLLRILQSCESSSIGTSFDDQLVKV